MAMSKEELFGSAETAPKRRGRCPRLERGSYLLCVSRMVPVRTEETRKESEESRIRYQAVVAEFHVLEASDGAGTPAGTSASVYFSLDAPKMWMRDARRAERREFLEKLTGESITALDQDDLLFGGGAVGLAVRCRAVDGRRAEYPEYFWDQVEQTAAQVEERRAKYGDGDE
jgi:hypothetical protein